jgi:hypothetical protein
MRTGIQKIQDYSSNYSQEVLMREQYTPTVLLSSFKNLIENVKQAMTEVSSVLTGSLNDKPAYAAAFSNAFLTNKEFKNIFEDLNKEVKDKNYTSYSSLKIAKVPSGIEMQYVDILKLLKDFASKDSLYWQINDYKEMLSKLLTQDQSLMRSSINRYSSSINKNNEPQQHIFNTLKSKIKDSDKDFVKVSVVVSNASQWSQIYELASDVNSWFISDQFDISKINNELKIIAGLIDGIIEELSSKTEVKGNSIILSELSESTLALANAVTLRANGVILCIETLGCIHETMVAVNQKAK